MLMWDREREVEGEREGEGECMSVYICREENKYRIKKYSYIYSFL